MSGQYGGSLTRLCQVAEPLVSRSAFFAALLQRNPRLARMVVKREAKKCARPIQSCFSQFSKDHQPRPPARPDSTSFGVVESVKWLRGC